MKVKYLGVMTDEIHINLYNQYFYLFTGVNNYKKAYKREPQTKGEINRDSNGILSCWIKDKKDIETICHESFHLAEILSKKTGIKFKGEVGAYLIEAIFRKINNSLK